MGGSGGSFLRCLGRVYSSSSSIRRRFVVENDEDALSERERGRLFHEYLIFHAELIHRTLATLGLLLPLRLLSPVQPVLLLYSLSYSHSLNPQQSFKKKWVSRFQDCVS